MLRRLEFPDEFIFADGGKARSPEELVALLVTSPPRASEFWARFCEGDLARWLRHLGHEEAAQRVEYLQDHRGPEAETLTQLMQLLAPAIRIPSSPMPPTQVDQPVLEPAVPPKEGESFSSIATSVPSPSKPAKAAGPTGGVPRPESDLLRRQVEALRGFWREEQARRQVDEAETETARAAETAARQSAEASTAEAEVQLQKARQAKDAALEVLSGLNVAHLLRGVTDISIPARGDAAAELDRAADRATHAKVEIAQWIEALKKRRIQVAWWREEGLYAGLTLALILLGAGGFFLDYYGYAPIFPKPAPSRPPRAGPPVTQSGSPAPVKVEGPPSTWNEFRSPEGEFSVLMPGTPTKQTRSVKTPSGPLEAHMFHAERGDVAYMVTYSDYPTMVVRNRPSKLILDGARDGAVANAHGTLVRESIVSLNGNHGRELNIEPAGGKVTIKARIFLVGHRLYQVMVLTPKGKDFSQDVRKFLDSFTLQPELPKPKTQLPAPTQIERDILAMLKQYGLNRVIVEVTRNLHVTLRGVVQEQSQIDVADRIAKSVKGVKSVSNLIVINRQLFPRDITVRLLRELRQSGLGEVDVNVGLDGSVKLTGRVDDFPDRDRAIAIAKRYPGVTGVSAEIKVRKEEMRKAIEKGGFE